MAKTAKSKYHITNYVVQRILYSFIVKAILELSVEARIGNSSGKKRNILGQRKSKYKGRC